MGETPPNRIACDGARLNSKLNSKWAYCLFFCFSRSHGSYDTYWNFKETFDWIFLLFSTALFYSQLFNMPRKNVQWGKLPHLPYVPTWGLTPPPAIRPHLGVNSPTCHPPMAQVSWTFFPGCYVLYFILLIIILKAYKFSMNHFIVLYSKVRYILIFWTLFVLYFIV